MTKDFKETDAIGLAVEHLNKKLGCEISTEYYSHIRAWRAWWENYVEDFHSYRELGVDNAPRKREIFRMGMAKRVTEDWAALLLNEKTAIAVKDAASSKYLQGDEREAGLGGVLEDCGFWSEGNELIEKAFALGSGAFVARANGAKVDNNGKVTPDAECKPGIEYLDGLSIIPLSIRESRITEAAFVSQFTERGKEVVYLETHTKDEKGNYVIENEYFILDGSQLKEADLPEGVAPRIETGSPLPWFALVYPNITNNIRCNNGLGMSVYANAIDNLKGVDIAYNNFIRDFKLGGKKVFYNKAMLQTNDKGKTITPDDVTQQLFQMIGDGMDFDAKSMAQEFNPSLRVTENKDGVQAQLDYLSFMCGLGTHRYQFDFSGVKTATEYTGEKQDLIQHASRHMIVIEAAIKTLCAALLYIGKTFCGAAVDPGTAITINFEDGFVISDEDKASKDLILVQNGILAPWEYRVRHFKEDEQKAKAAIDGMKTASSNPFGFVG